MCELHSLRSAVGPEEIAFRKKWFALSSAVSPVCEPGEPDRAAATSCARNALARRRQLGSLAHYHERAEGNEREDFVTSMIPGHTLLTGPHVPVAGEYEVKNVQSMKIMDHSGPADRSRSTTWPIFTTTSCTWETTGRPTTARSGQVTSPGRSRNPPAS